ncbi:Glutathione synthetase [Meloidogyne graminicola]|uniref:Glutathione synthetase n=1 Tax=Meloidogyne graminicola TaxID=189291 RepID=A0A8S9ZFC2_9BILA|nr:Glutathione synthetase [Meloidogyne graminicola]
MEELILAEINCKKYDKKNFNNINFHYNKKTIANNYVLEAIENDENLKELTDYSVNYAHTIGFVGLLCDHKQFTDLSVVPPMTLLPSPFPMELFQKAISVQTTLNELYFRISLDYEFLIEAYRDVVKADKWVARQVEMLKTVHADGIRQKYVLQVLRADYMTHCENNQNIELKQIEINMGPGGVGFAPKISKLHRKMLDKVESLQGCSLTSMSEAAIPQGQKIAEALFQAWKLFGDPKAIVVLVFDSKLFPIQHHEQVQFVQFDLEKLANNEGLNIIVSKMTIEECADRMYLEKSDYSLMVKDDKRVAVVYMVYGYSPEHYISEKEWNCQLDMERSTAIISPNIRSQLSGTKKVQQLLAKPNVLERFLKNRPKQIDELKSTFTGIWSLEGNDSQTQALVNDAIEHPQNYVLKALRDDGVGNFFDESISEMLQTMPIQERSAFILQKKIRPITVKNYLKRPFHSAKLENVTNELGVFGTFLGTYDGQVLLNNVDGHFIKTKTYNSNQGGIGEGSGVIDSALLFPEKQFLKTC